VFDSSCSSKWISKILRNTIGSRLAKKEEEGFEVIDLHSQLTPIVRFALS